MADNTQPGPQITLLTAARLRTSGTSPGQIRTRVRHRELVPIGRGVYVPSTIARQFAAIPHGSHLLQAAAALCLNTPGCVISHQSAALAHHIDLTGEQPAEITPTAGNGGRRGHRNGIHRYANSVAPRTRYIW